jgi:hypothetical protein
VVPVVPVNKVAEEREVAFIDNVADCLMDVASVYGPYWEPYFKKLLPSLMDYLVRRVAQP